MGSYATAVLALSPGGAHSGWESRLGKSASISITTLAQQAMSTMGAREDQPWAAGVRDTLLEAVQLELGF